MKNEIKITPSVRTINYTVSKPETYHSIEVTFDFNKTKTFNSGDFVLDWYNSFRFIFDMRGKEFETTDSPSVKRFIADGAPFKAMYWRKHFPKNGEYIEPLSDKMGDYQHWGNHLFFVKEGTTPTWKELREICNDTEKRGGPVF